MKIRKKQVKMIKMKFNSPNVQQAWKTHEKTSKIQNRQNKLYCIKQKNFSVIYHFWNSFFFAKHITIILNFLWRGLNVLSREIPPWHHISGLRVPWRGPIIYTPKWSIFASPLRNGPQLTSYLFLFSYPCFMNKLVINSSNKVVS